MKKLIALVLALITITTVFVFPTHAADGGAGNLSITSHSDGDEVNGDEDIKIKWSRVSGADHYHLTIKDTVTGEKPFDEHVSGTSKTIKANTVFLVEGRTYKVYACAMDKNSNVLNRGNDWEAVYVSVKSNEPKLTYASPCLISPEEIEVKYLSNRNCYYGVATQSLDPKRDVTLKFEDVYSGNYSVSAAILSGEPDFGSSNEAKLLSIAAQQNQSSRKFKIDSEDLIPGKFLKFAVQGIDEQGNYSLMSHFYFHIENSAESDENLPVKDDTNQESKNVTFFLQNQSPWHDHPYGHKDEDCRQSTDLAYSGCGVLSLTNAVYNLNGCFIDPTFIADYAMDNGHRICGVGTSYTLYPSFASKYGVQYGFKYGTRYTEVDFSTMRKELENGAVIIANTPGHFFVIAQYDIDTDTYLVLDSLPSKNRGTTENGDWKTASQLSSGSLKVRYYITLLKASDTSDTDSPIVVDPIVNGGTLEMSIPTTTATPGDTVEIPIMITKNSGFAFIQLDIDSDLDYVIENATSDFSMVEGKSTIFYGNSDKVGTFALAMLKVRVPDTAKDGHRYNISVNVIDCYNLEEQQLSCAGTSGTINVSAIMIGDVNFDNQVTPLDVIRLVKYLCGQDVAINETASDISKDGKINGIDLILLLKILLA